MADKKLTKSVGEHWACSVMAGLGWSVALTRDGLERTDLIGVHTLSGRMVSVQVKTASHHPSPSWMFGHKGLQPARSDSEWFLLVGLARRPWEAPRSFVVPRDHVAAGFWISYQNWLTDPTAKPGTRNTRISNARTFDWVFSQYEDRWDLLTGPTTNAPVLLPTSFRSLALNSRVGLPPGHPWQTALPSW